MPQAVRVKTDSFHTPDYVFWDLGASVQEREIKAVAVGPHTDTSTNTAACDIPYSPSRASFAWVMFLGGLSGDDTEGAWLMRQAWDYWVKHFEYRLVGLAVCDQLNPDGMQAGQLLNANGVDLNRNFATRDWKKAAQEVGAKAGSAPCSEPECHIVSQMVEACRPSAIVVTRTTDRSQIVCDGPSRSMGETLARMCRQSAVESRSAPGSLGVFAGKERGFPMITLEIKRGTPKEQIYETYMPLLDEVMRYWENRL